MTLYKFTNGERELCAWCFRKDLRLLKIYFPYTCWICSPVPGSGDQRQICQECLERIEKEHKIDAHQPVDLV